LPASDLSKQFPDDFEGFAGVRLIDSEGSEGGEGASAFISCQGAQVLSWRAVDGKERLYLSSISEGMRRGDRTDAISLAIRGGAPVCFPQFSDRGPLLKHGFARGLAWQRETAGNRVRLSLGDSDLTRRHWPHAFRAEVSVTLVKDTLTIALEVTNHGNSPWSFTSALHTYLAVDNIRDTRLLGLKNVRYQDATAGNVELVQQEDLLTIPGEVDRVYLSAPKEVLLTENNSPALSIRQSGFEDTVVWNPGPEKAQALRDFPDEDWLHMLCVEAAQVVNPILLEPGQMWLGTQTLSVSNGD
jgi:glucose-6-phosphate 1-epimerase